MAIFNDTLLPYEDPKGRARFRIKGHPINWKRNDYLLQETPAWYLGLRYRGYIWIKGKQQPIGHALIRELKSGTFQSVASCVYVHQVVAAIKYGLKGIPKGFHVHHINFCKNDNRPENLVILREGDHNRLHAHRDLSRYESGKTWYGSSYGRYAPKRKQPSRPIIR